MRKLLFSILFLLSMAGFTWNSFSQEDAKTEEKESDAQTIPAIESVKKVDKAYLTVIKSSKDKYVKVLQSLSDAEQKKGNLDGIEELKSEIEKMNVPETMTSSTEFKNPVAKKAQDAFRKEVDTAKIKYVAELQKAQAGEVKAGKIDNAKVIKAYIATLQTSTEGDEKTDKTDEKLEKSDVGVEAKVVRLTLTQKPNKCLGEMMMVPKLISVPTKDAEKKTKALYRIVKGLANPECVSFESIQYPGNFLRHFGFQLKLEPEKTITLKEDATFRIVPGLSRKTAVSFVSLNYPSRYIAVNEKDEFWVLENPPKGDATFNMVEAE